MASEEYDLVTIGAGSGGVRASRFAAQYYQAKVACIELPFGFISSDSVGGAGGTCVIRGCVPKKLLVYGSHFAEEFQDAQGFGWASQRPSFDWKTLISNKSKEITRLNSVYNSILKSAGVEYIEGKGSLVDAHTVQVELTSGGTHLLKTKNILIATGGSPSKIPIEGAEYAVTSDEALHLEDLPQGKIVVVGSGYIACEFAGIFSGVGADTHLMFRAEKALRGFDEDCRQAVMENLQAHGVNVHAKSLPTRIEKVADHQYVLHYKGETGEQKMECGLVMLATGRKPKTDGLGLEKVGIQLNDKGAIHVDQYSRTTVPSVWAIGDVTDRINLTPVALMEGMAFTKTCFGGVPTAPDYQFVASAVFCQPPLASVGFTEEQAVEHLSGDVDVYISKFKPMKYTISGRDQRTLMKLIVHSQSDRVVGCHMVGPDSPEIMQGLAIALKCGATKAQFDSTVGIHPTAAEEFVTMRTKTRTRQCTGTCKL